MPKLLRALRSLPLLALAPFASVASVAMTGCSSDDGGGGASGEPAAMSGMTAAHNQVRANVSPAANPALPPLTWSSTVAATAQAWANGCKFTHSGGSYGENIYATTGSATPAAVVSSWASEVSDYDYATNACSGVCGHYTQVVWRDSLRLGCGVANCTTGSPFGSGGGAWQLWVCNYDPPGNYTGNKPY
jgi:uncharacterized protein YkwD